MFCFVHSKFPLLFSSFAIGKVENTLWRLHDRTRCCIAMFLKLACAVAVGDSKFTEVRGNFVENECYRMATEFQETALRPDISVTCA